MQLSVPFTDIKIAIGKDPSKDQSRGSQYGRFSRDVSNPRDGIKISASSFFVAYRNSSDLFSCIREITETCGIGGIFWYDPSDPDKEASNADIEAVNNIFKYQYDEGINGYKEAAFQQYLLTGNKYTEKVRGAIGDEVIGVKVLDARTMGVVTDIFGHVYNYVQGNPYSSEMTKDSTIFGRDDVIHWKKGIDPNNEAFGLSPMEPILWEVRADISAQIANYHFFENDAVPAVQYIMDPEFSAEQVKEAVEIIREQYKGAKNRGKSGALWGVKEVKQLMMSHTDMQFLEGRKFTTQKVCSAYGVPPSILGYTEGVNYTNHEGQMKKFYEGTVRKYELAFQEFVNEQIIKGCLGEEAYNKIRLRILPASFETEDMLWDRASKAREKGLVSINEARSIVGYDNIDQSKNGDLGDEIIFGTGIEPRPLLDVGVDPATDPEKLEAVKSHIEKLDGMNRASSHNHDVPDRS